MRNCIKIKKFIHYDVPFRSFNAGKLQPKNRQVNRKQQTGQSFPIDRPITSNRRGNRKQWTGLFFPCFNFIAQIKTKKTFRLLISMNLPNIAIMNESTVHIAALTIGYRFKGREKVVAKHLCADIKSGELTCLLGTNGIGKSTLLKTLSAFLPPLSGQIILMGKDISTYSERELSQIISIVLTEKCNIRNLTAYELVGLGRNPYTGFWGKLSMHDHEIIENSLRQVGMLHFKNQTMDIMSDGERQKIMIAKALAQETPIILLDEPTAFLDFPSKVEILKLLRRLSRHLNKTVFLSTHDIELALQVADRLWLMSNNGRLKTGIPEDLTLDGSLANFFINENITFDQTSGLFKINNDSTRRIGLTGDGQAYNMVRKALLRYGIETGGQGSSDITIEATDTGAVNSFIVHYENGISTTTSTIEELLLCIMRDEHLSH